MDGKEVTAGGREGVGQPGKGGDPGRRITVIAVLSLALAFSLPVLRFPEIQGIVRSNRAIALSLRDARPDGSLVSRLFESTDRSLTIVAALVGQGRWHLWKNEPESAVTVLQQAITLAPEDREANFFLGRALTEANRLEEAAEVFRRTELSNRTEDFNFLTHTAWVNLEAARLRGPRAPEWEKAERYYQVARLLYPDDWRHWRNTADFYLYYRLDEDRGTALLRQAEEAFPKSILPHLEAARYLGKKSRRAELLEALRRAVARKPDNPEIFESAYEVLREDPSLGLPEWLLLARRGLRPDNGVRARFEELQKRVESAEPGGRAG